MKFDTKSNGRYLIVTILEERLGADRALSFKESMAKLMDKGHRAFILDLSRVNFIDSSGLGAILATAKRVGKAGDILVVGTSETVGSMFKLTRMDRIFPMFASVEEAVSAHV
jgi:anti-sigma B factor antagonist